MKGYFVTGTGTGVGKTYVAARLSQIARRAGAKVFSFKPIETGCTWLGGELIGADQSLLVEAAGGWQAGEFAGVYRFEPPVAPAVAGGAMADRPDGSGPIDRSQRSLTGSAAHPSKAGVIDLNKILRVFREGTRQADFTIVEGAGGWRVPITATEDMSTLAQRCGLPVIVVATATLGTINHTLLTVEAVERDGLHVAGVVLSRLPEDDIERAQSNREQIQTRWPGRVLVLNNDSDLEVFHVKHFTRSQ